MKNSILAITTGILLIGIGWLASFRFFGDPPLDRAAEELATAIEEKKSVAEKEVALLAQRFAAHGVDSTRVLNADYYAQLFDRDGLFLAAFENNELAFWSDNRVAFDYLFGPGIPSEQYLKLENGWYGLLKEIEDDREYYALFLIRTAYPYQNTYLQDDFQPDINLPNLYSIVLTPTPTTAPVVIGDQTVFHLERTGRNEAAGLWLNMLLLIFGTILLFYGIDRLTAGWQQQWLAVFLLPAIVVGLRLLSLQFSNPFADIKLFDPALYASSYLFPSLGDLFIDSLLLAYTAHFICKRLAKTERLRLHWWSAALALWVFFSYALFISPLVIGLIEDSRINFQINQIFNLDVYTLLAVVSIALLLYSLYQIGLAVVQRFRRTTESSVTTLLAMLVALAAHILLAHLVGIVDFKIILWPLPALLLIAAIQFENDDSRRVRTGLVLLIYLSLVTSLAVLKYSAAKERSERMIFAEKLASDEDPVTELLFSSVVKSIQESSAIRDLLEQPQKYANPIAAQRIADLFIDRYWNKYEFDIHVYHPDSSYWGILPESRPPPLAEYGTLIEEHGYPTGTNPNLFHLYNYPENLSYLAMVPVQHNDSTPLAIAVIGLKSTLFPDEIGFPELLIDQSTERPRDMEGYSFARYVGDKLISTGGEYSYRINAQQYKERTARFAFEAFDHHSHLVHRVDDKTLVVVSKEQLTFFDRMTVFSYLFALFGLLFLLFFLLENPTLLRPGLLNHLNVKIQLLSASIILVALVSFGSATRFYTERQFQEKNKSILSEKIQSVMIELETLLKNETTVSEPLVDQLKARLTKLSYVFFTDINIYDTSGQLIASSQPKIFESGLVAPKMNAEAYAMVAINKKSDYIHRENIGALNHLSAYVPFRNFNNDIIAFVNLPYFARQDALEDEINRLFVALVNLFVLLLALSVFAAIFISDWITRPLQRLQQSLSKIELGRHNEPIEYRGTDVIGDLVKEYNRKVTELEINAEQLARSERESAWREMAKQVAHEIKNPLTPMKLNIQLLQKAVSEGSADIGSRVERTADVLIEQIDTLSEIASAFSNFAKMPRAELAQVNLNKLVGSAVELYKELPGSEVRFRPLDGTAPVVRADYNQLLRAIQNLIKNGLQATEDENEPHIKLAVKHSERGFVIAVSDNGPGIPAEMQDRIFRPNFTTKSTGMGMGLAMVQSIVLNVNGKIWFETEKGKGTTFFIELPADR